MQFVLLAACLLSCASLGSTQGPLFLEENTNITVREGETIQLTCSVQDLGRFKVAWINLKAHKLLTVGSHVVTRDHRVTLTHSNNNNSVWTLRISGALKMDSGWYLCQVNTVQLLAQRHYVSVVDPPSVAPYSESSSKKPLPKFTSKMKNVTAFPGDNITFTCQVEHLGDYKVTWLFRDRSGLLFMGHERWTHEKRFSVESDSDDHIWHLHIQDIQPRDKGVYACAIASQPNWLIQNGYLNVTQKLPPSLPSFAKPMRDVEAVEGGNASFSCIMENLGGHLVSWISLSTGTILAIGRTILQENSRISVFPGEDDKGWILHISNLQLDDSGKYQCQINSQPQLDQLATLRVNPFSTTAVTFPLNRDEIKSTSKLSPEADNETYNNSPTKLVNKSCSNHLSPIFQQVSLIIIFWIKVKVL